MDLIGDIPPASWPWTKRPAVVDVPTVIAVARLVQVPVPPRHREVSRTSVPVETRHFRGAPRETWLGPLYRRVRRRCLRVTPEAEAA
jgi:hypothetical protein